ncbi:Zinc finger FYVE domain-containing protein 9 [Armadillidium vulgare]|nr:Zinc finger FYVE domain-containing protein 9 [Armadillidium vulgare]
MVNTFNSLFTIKSKTMTFLLTKVENMKKYCMNFGPYTANHHILIWKALNNSNDHVLALGANFSLHADSHLVTVEDDDGHYTTQAINIHNKPRKVTGASFIVFNGALKSNSGLKAKSSIVEDGLMVQISGEMMSTLRESLRNMKEFDIPCGPSSLSQPDELILIRWVQDDRNFNIGIKSPIDGKSMDGIPSVKIHSGTDYVGSDHLIRWTEVFIIQGEASTSNNDVNISRLAESLARACCMALIPHLALLYDSGPNRLALRVTIHQDNVEYEAGLGGKRLLPLCMNELDAELIPVIHRAAANIADQAIILELLFHIMEQ